MRYKIQIDNVTKNFGTNNALSAINLSLLEGKIYSFLGENGAGKSTLMNIISGYYPPTEGKIAINGKTIVKYNPRFLNKEGVGMVHQQLSLIDKFSIFENIILGTEHSFYKKNEASESKINTLFEMLEVDFKLDEIVGRLTVAEKQIVEIINLLYKECEVLILDEPFSQLSNIEATKLIRIIKELSEKFNKTILFISHDIDEVRDISDYVVVLRKGRLVKIAKNDEQLQNGHLIELMIGESDFTPSIPDNEVIDRLAFVKFKNIKIFDSKGSKAKLDVAHLELKKGEIMGLAGVLNNGQGEFIDLLLGKMKFNGTIKLFEENVNSLDIKNKIRASIIPLNVRENGVFIDLTIHENLSFNDIINTKKNYISNVKNRDYSQSIVDRYDVRPNQIDLLARNLSGGNLQKMVISREIQNTSDLLIALNPMSGLDIQYSTRVFEEFRILANRGACVIFQSTNLNHLYDICDRISVFNKGKITGTLNKIDFNNSTVGNLMLN